MLWDEGWLRPRRRQRDLWRGVEAQHRVATMKLVDALEEQEILEQILEGSKPRLPPAAQGMHFLLATPFRYVSPWPSRFRRAGEQGAWYGADAPRTVAAETAYWRWRFFIDSAGLQDQQVVVELTFFQARFSGLELDITAPPWNAHRATWRDPLDYTHCHALATHARSLAPPVQAIRYESARIVGGMCAVVFDARTLDIVSPGLQQTWICKITKERVILSHDSDSLQFDMA